MATRQNATWTEATVPKCQCDAHKAERLSRLGMWLSGIALTLSALASILAWR